MRARSEHEALAEALDVALCWGWIDGVRKSYDAESFLQRFSPRRAKNRSGCSVGVTRLDADVPGVGADDRFFGWVAYTLSRSERRSVNGEGLALFQYDQPHILTALGSYKLGDVLQAVLPGAAFTVPDAAGVMVKIPQQTVASYLGVAREEVSNPTVVPRSAEIKAALSRFRDLVRSIDWDDAECLSRLRTCARQAVESLGFGLPD